MIERVPNLVTQVLQELEKRVFCGAIAPGEKVNESHLASELGVSRGPIREACRLLESEQILVSVPQRGSFVRTINAKEAADLFSIREELSDIIAKSIIDNAPAELAQQLDVFVSKMDADISRGGLEEFFPVNLEFHELLLGSTGNARLTEIFIGLFKELRIFRIQSFLPERDKPDLVTIYNRQSNAGHKLIVKALAAGSYKDLRAAMRQQVIDSRERSFAAFERAGGEAALINRKRA